MDINFTFTEEQVVRLEALKKKYGKDSIKDVVLMALFFVDQCEDEVENGQQICSVNELDGIIKIMEIKKDGKKKENNIET